MAISVKDEQGEEQNVEYETDPEEEMVRVPTRRRKEASDDEGGEESEKEGRFEHRRVSDSESDGQGGVEEEEVEEGEEEVEEEEEEVEVEEEEEEVEVEEEEEEVVEVEFEEKGKVREGEGGGEEGEREEVGVKVAGLVDKTAWCSDGEQGGIQEKNSAAEGEKAVEEKEPFTVPTTGAFYMHDDRFGSSARNRHRHTAGGRKLWETKDNQKWGHDKYEEMNLQQTRYGKEKRTSKGSYRGRGKNRGMKPGYVGENKSNAHVEHDNQNHASKVVKGRGPRRYRSPATTNNGVWPTRYNPSKKSNVTTSNASSARAPTHDVNVQSDLAAHRKNVFASSLNSASPPFYPSGSSNSGSSPIAMQKRDARVGSTNRNVPSNVEVEDNFSTSHSNAFLQGKNTGNSNGQDRLYMNKSISEISNKLSNVQMHSAANVHSRTQGRNLVKGKHTYHSASSVNQEKKFLSQPQLPVVRQAFIGNQVQPSVGSSNDQLGLHAGAKSQSSSPKIQSGNSSESGEAKSPPGSSKSMAALDGGGKNNVQRSGRGSFLFSGAGVYGAGSMGIPHGDHNFPAAPTLFQVMQFGGQHPSGMGVPAVGMALPGYVAQPQHGFANSEVPWLPPLAGAAMHSSSPYIAMDDGYSTNTSGPTSSLGVSSREITTSISSTALKPTKRHELATDEFAQRQNKPRRYSEMNFGQ